LGLRQQEEKKKKGNCLDGLKKAPLGKREGNSFHFVLRGGEREKKAFSCGGGEGKEGGEKVPPLVGRVRGRGEKRGS